jgi:short subunit dehydrogenase-like uncharacterized protein
MRIAVHGASGFTGGLTVAELCRRGIEPVLVGRDAERLRKAAAGAGAAGAEVRVAGLDDPDGLAAAFGGCAAVVNCAGPFTLLGEPVVRAALAAGVHYVDTTGERGYAEHILGTYGEAAARAGVTVVPAMADDGGPGDLIAHLTAARLTSVDELTIADLRRPGAVSRGTARSMAAITASGGTALGEGPDAGGALGSGGGAPEPGLSLQAPGEEGLVAVSGFDLPGLATIPRHVRARRVRAVIRSEVAGLFGALTPEMVETVPETPDPAARAAARWLMLAEAADGAGNRARGWVTGLDGYRLTAVIAVEGARRLAGGTARAGALAPAQAFDPADFLDHLAPEGVTWQVTGPAS